MSLVVDMNLFAREFEIERSKYVCAIRRNTYTVIDDESLIREINLCLSEQELGIAMPFATDEDGFWFYLFFHNDDKGLKLVRRILIEKGVNLDAEITMVSPKRKTLKKYGNHK